jgi:twinkle protein
VVEGDRQGGGLMARTFADVGIEIPSGKRGEIDLLCPECSHTRKKSRDKCLSVNTDTGTWFCQHCGWAGGLGGVDPNAYGSPLPKSYTPPAPRTETAVSEAVAAWFETRGIPDWVLADNGITSGMEFCPALGKEAMTIRYPYLRGGELVNYKFRAHPKHFWMSGGAERILYGLDGIADAETICIVEGEMDKLSIDAVQGWPTVSVPDGAPAENATNYASKFAFLSGEAEERFAAAKAVILATDMDAPGRKLADELARRIGYAKCQRVSWPDGCKDANDTLVKLGKKAVLDALADAQPYPVAGIVTVRELSHAIDDLYERGYDRGVTAGWSNLDMIYRARPGLLAIVTGSPGAGKSHVLDNLIVRLAERHGWTFGICSPENQPLARHAAGMLAIYLGEPFSDGPTPRMSREELASAKRWLEGRVAFILPEEPSIEAIIERADVLVYRMGIRGLVIDPWNELDHARPATMTETEYTSHALTRIRNWARLRSVQVWLVAHPTKLRKDEDGAYPVPTPYDISGSSHFFNKADACLSVWRDATDASVNTQVHVQKIRFAETGQIGRADFTYERETGRIREALRG